MIRETDDICGYCKKLTTKGYPEEMAQGKGKCTGYDDDAFTTLADPIVPWNMRPCVRFVHVWGEDKKRREPWLDKQRAKQNNNAAQPETKG